MSAIIVVDAFWGDSGKGKVSAWLSRKHRAAYCVRAGTGTNAGHSVYFEDGREIRTHQLPCGFLDPGTGLRVGSGVAVDPQKLDSLVKTLRRPECPVYHTTYSVCLVFIGQYIVARKCAESLNLSKMGFIRRSQDWLDTGTANKTVHARSV